MVTIPQVAEAMQTVLTTTADNAAQETGFVQRESKMGGAAFAQTLVFGWLENPEATLEELRACEKIPCCGLLLPRATTYRKKRSAKPTYSRS